MPVLRLRQTAEGGDAYRVVLELEAGGQRCEETLTESAPPRW